MSEDTRDFDALRAFCDELEASGLVSAPCRWGITKPAVLRGAGRPRREIHGSDTDSCFKEYALPDGSVAWDIALMSQDGVEGIPYYSESFLIASPALAERAESIDAWLRENPDAYELFTPILWSAAPERAAQALAWLSEHRARCMASPLRAEYEALEAELQAAVG